MRRSDNPIVNPEVIMRKELDDMAVLFNPANAAALGINGVGIAVWELLDGQHSIDQIVTEVKQRFTDVPDAATDDIQGFVAELVNKGFAGYEILDD